MSNEISLGRSFDVTKYRSLFPALTQKTPRIYFDSVGGTQIPSSAISAITDYLTYHNGNKGGVFPESQATDDLMQKTREAIADFLNATSPQEIVFGPNFTTIAFNMSRAISRQWNKGDEIVVSRLDHDANVSPWIRAAEDRGVIVRYADITDGTGMVNQEQFAELLSSRTRLIAFCAASSSIGTCTDVKALSSMAHEVGSIVYVDAVAYAPHSPIDVQDWDIDFLGFSGYKMFGPHVGLLWGKENYLRDLMPYKIDSAPQIIPERWMNGAQQYELLAGLLAAIDYLTKIGRDHPEYQEEFLSFNGRRRELKAAMAAIRDYEKTLIWQVINGIKKLQDYRIWGIADESSSHWRVSPVAVSCTGAPPSAIASYLSQNNINVWSRSVYSALLSTRLGLSKEGGFIRIGLAHYNTPEEVNILLNLLESYIKS